MSTDGLACIVCDAPLVDYALADGRRGYQEFACGSTPAMIAVGVCARGEAAT